MLKQTWDFRDLEAELTPLPPLAVDSGQYESAVHSDNFLP